MAESTALASSPTWEKIRPTLQRLTRPFPYSAVFEAQLAQEEITPHLLDVITELAREPARAIASDYMLHLYAICLLAKFRETRAYRPMIQLAAQPDEIAEEIFGDFISENLGRAIASVCDGDLGPIKSLVENQTINVWVRGAGMTALAYRFLESEPEAKEAPLYLETVGNREAERLRELPTDQRDTSFLSLVVFALCDTDPTAAMDSIRGWFDLDLIDETMSTLEEVEDGTQESFNEHREHICGGKSGYVRNAIDEMEHWVCFDPDEDEEDLDYSDEDFQIPYVREEPKIGRNEPCPCGSGKKYKKCCGAAF